MTRRFERLLGRAGERLGARAPKLRYHPAPVRDQHDLSGGHLAEIRAEPVFQLPHGDGLHGDNVAARGYNLKPRAMCGQSGSPAGGGTLQSSRAAGRSQRFARVRKPLPRSSRSSVVISVNS